MFYNNDDERNCKNYIKILIKNQKTYVKILQFE